MAGAACGCKPGVTLHNPVPIHLPLEQVPYLIVFDLRWKVDVDGQFILTQP